MHSCIGMIRLRSCQLVSQKRQCGLQTADIDFSAYEGLVGFISDPALIGVGSNDKGFLRNLYHQGQIEELRFGMALGSSGQGQQILGGVDENLINSDLTRVPIENQWYIKDTAVTVGGSVLAEKQELLFDSGGPQVSHGPFVQCRITITRTKRD